MLRWHDLPIVVVRRTSAMIDALRDEKLLARMVDPRSAKSQQPAYAANWHRSIDPALSVLIGVCTYCARRAAVLRGCARRLRLSLLRVAFRSGGHPYAGPSQYNRPVPSHEIIKPFWLAIGRNEAARLLTQERFDPA